MFITQDKQILTMLSTPIVELNPMSHKPNLIATWIDTVNILLNESDKFLEKNSVSEDICNIVLKLVIRKSDVQNYWIQKYNSPDRGHRVTPVPVAALG